jgi:GTPase involved in cell partitioning and DNA repair
MVAMWSWWNVYLVVIRTLDLVSSQVARHIKLDMVEVVETESTGADGEDKFIEVPLGTVVRDENWRDIV